MNKNVNGVQKLLKIKEISTKRQHYSTKSVIFAAVFEM